MTLVVKIPLYLELIRFLQFAVKQVESYLSMQPLITTSSSAVNVCTDGRDRIVESADKGRPKVLETGQFDFLGIAHFEFVASSLYGSKVSGLVQRA